MDEQEYDKIGKGLEFLLASRDGLSTNTTQVKPFDGDLQNVSTNKHMA
jgi:hypothetical protein